MPCTYTKASATSGKTDHILHLRSSSGFLPSVTSSNLLSVPKGSQRLSLLLTPALHNHNSHKALQLECKDWATRRETPRFTLSLMQIWRLLIRGCISKLEEKQRQILLSFNPASKKWRPMLICKLLMEQKPFSLHPKQGSCIYLHHPEYPGHNLLSTKSGQHGGDPCGQQDAGGSGHAMNEKKIKNNLRWVFMHNSLPEFYPFPPSSVYTPLFEVCSSSSWHTLVYKRLSLILYMHKTPPPRSATFQFILMVIYKGDILPM